MKRNFKDLVLMEKYILEAEDGRKMPNLSRGEASVLGSYFDELGRLLFKYLETTDENLKRKYFDKFVNAYEDTKKRVDNFIKEQ